MSVIAYSEENKGWTSFYTYSPEGLENVLGNFFSFKDGQLFKHNSDQVLRNSFYNTATPSKISLIINDAPNDRKVINSIILQGSTPWRTVLKAYIDNLDTTIETAIETTDFVQKEGIWYAYTRKGTNVSDYDTKAAYGIGQIKNITGSNVRVDYIPDNLSEGDSIIKYDGVSFTTIGTITNLTNTTMALSSVAGLSVSDFIFGYKDPKHEGSRLRGYAIRADLTNSTYSNNIELFSVDYEVIKSFM